MRLSKPTIMNINQKTALKIKSTRENIGLTAESVAMDLGISKSAYSQLENGHTEISINRLQQISTILKIPMETLLPQNQQPIQINKDNSCGNIQNGNVENQYNYTDKESVELLKNALRNMQELMNRIK